jgi:aspartyl-tRNA(Asn)/glutamyl-tRNA(Gln) amidotransferase subunit A
LFSFTTIAQYHKDLLQGDITCQDAVAFYNSNIKTNHSLNAFAHTYENEALLKAAELDTFRKQNPSIPLKKLHGVVISIKDVICYNNHPTTAASKMLHNYKSIYNATAVQKLLNEDAIIIGHNNCDEFAMGSGSENSYYGIIKNATNIKKVPGGSSGGSAVAIQANMSMVSLGSDTGGSVRQPADFCGIVGLKPTYGRVSRHGLIAYASSFDQIGILSKNVEDAALVLEVIAGKDEFDTTLLDEEYQNSKFIASPKKIVYIKEAIENPLLDEEIKNAFFEKIETLKINGHNVVAIDFPLLQYVVPTYYVLTTAEASSNLNRYDGVKFGYRTKSAYKDLTEFYKLNRSEGFGKEVQKRIMLGTFVLSSGYYDAYFTKAQQVRTLLKEAVENIFAHHDFILMPNAPTTAPDIGENKKDPIAAYLADVYTGLVNLTGIPAIAIPYKTHSNGMPFGLQLLAANSKENELLNFAEELIK